MSLLFCALIFAVVRVGETRPALRLVLIAIVYALLIAGMWSLRDGIVVAVRLS